MEKHIKLLVIDVDGTMTDSGIYYDESGNEIKKFSTRDAAAFFAASASGIKTMVLTGRESRATEKRMKELNVDWLYQNIKDKKAFLNNFLKQNDIFPHEVAFIGDDLNDYPLTEIVGLIGCPADSCQEIKDIADYISISKGGEGAVRDIVEHWLKKYGLWDESVKRIYSIGC